MTDCIILSTEVRRGAKSICVENIAHVSANHVMDLLSHSGATKKWKMNKNTSNISGEHNFSARFCQNLESGHTFPWYPRAHMPAQSWKFWKNREWSWRKKASSLSLSKMQYYSGCIVVLERYRRLSDNFPSAFPVEHHYIKRRVGSWVGRFLPGKHTTCWGVARKRRNTEAMLYGTLTTIHSSKGTQCISLIQLRSYKH